jgi:hypothetical protein
MSKMARKVYLADFFAFMVLFSMATTFTVLFDSGGTRDMSMESIVPHNSRMIEFKDNKEKEIEIIPMKENYEQFHKDAPVCAPLEEHEVTFGLAIALKESELSMVSHHCRRWGISAPISIAVLTDMSPERVAKKLKSFQYNKCRPEQLTIATLSAGQGRSSATASDTTYPLNQLRNLAIQGLSTTHIVYLDIDMWTSVELYDTLNSPSIRRELAKNPLLAIVLPAFEVDPTSFKSRSECVQNIPATFESLIMQLTEKTAGVMGPNDIALQGSTLYRSWVRQKNAELVPIDCVSSDYYEPFLAVRYCQSLPPFQEVLTYDAVEDEANDTKHDLMSTWIIHLLWLGHSLRQVGSAFVVYMPPASKNNVDKPKETSALRAKRQKKFTRRGFLEWLDRSVPDLRTMKKCEDFEASGDETAQ